MAATVQTLASPINEGTEEIFQYIKTSIDDEETFHFMGFEFLQRLNIVQIQNDLIVARDEIFASRCNDKKAELKALLNDYGEYTMFCSRESYSMCKASAVRNYNYVHEMRRLDHRTTEDRKQRLKAGFPRMVTEFRNTRPFESHYYFLNDNSVKVDALRDNLRQWLPSRLSYTHQERRYRAKEFEEGKAPVEVSTFVDRLARFIVAVIGIASLVIPMLIMSIRASQTKSLITASVSTVLFAIVLSFGLKTTNVETLVSTATYSAVLVVFVGANTNSP